MEEIITPSRICLQRPKYLIDIDTNILKSMLEKISKRTCQKKVNHMWRLFFEELNIKGQCELFVEMMRILKFRPIMKFLG